MVSHMKTTIQIPDSLFEEARRVAELEHTTLKALVEQGLRRTVAERKRKGAFRLRKATFKGKGLQPALAGHSWEQLRDLSYEGRGA
jgi:CRISPR/Cas system-associated protein Csm6